MTREELKAVISAGLECSHLEVMGDDDRHFKAIVVSPAFEGLSMVKQHQMVYATLGNRMQTDEVHALELKTFAPSKWNV